MSRKDKKISKEGFLKGVNSEVRGKLHDFQKNEKVRKVSTKLDEAEKKFNFPKTMTGVAIAALGGIMLWNRIPFHTEVLATGISMTVAGIGFKLNRKFLGGEAMNRIEKLIFEIIKKGMRR